ncbi:hypothetical protein HYW29_00280 [Candidatus Amesbacteria bacterium]|nr:hypothetical protein [Candidatus Amesbacteria bacterium]
MLISFKKKKSIVISIALIALVGFIYWGLYYGYIPTILGLEKEVAKYNTVYIEGFSWDKMSRVQKGMTPQEVLQIMGEPYGGMTDKPFCPSWSYGNPNPWERFPPLAEDFWWITAQVCFDTETNTVSYPGVEHVFFN